MKATRDIPWWQRHIAGTLSIGPIPNHVAFILDGNRRWARERNVATSEGHKVGAKTLMELGNFLEALGTKELTVYAFSIENFKRPKEEVDFLMDLLVKIAEEFRKLLPKMRFRFVGNLKLLPKDIQDLILELLEKTKDNGGIVVNIAIAYTCRDDITRGIVKVLDKEMDPKFINGQTIQDNMYTKDFSDVDILIRTSGETRLSDFLLWEVSEGLKIFKVFILEDFIIFRSSTLGCAFWIRIGRRCTSGI